MHPFGGLANTGSALNICVHLRLTAFSRIKNRDKKSGLAAAFF
jgi:hypothetical protein